MSVKCVEIVDGENDSVVARINCASWEEAARIESETSTYDHFHTRLVDILWSSEESDSS